MVSRMLVLQTAHNAQVLVKFDMANIYTKYTINFFFVAGFRVMLHSFDMSFEMNTTHDKMETDFEKNDSFSGIIFKEKILIYIPKREIQILSNANDIESK